jgi:predicted NAD/FAD-binding protein
VCLHYLLNRLQPLPFNDSVVVSLNPVQPVAEQHVLGSYDYEHPVFDLIAIQAQKQVAALQGQRGTYYCGAWTGYGFHEDGLKSGLDVARRIQQTLNVTELLAA